MIFKLEKVKEKIYHLEFGNQYDMCMSFLRYQEYYESPNPKFCGNSFTIVEYMKWYTEQNGSFSYIEDWGGFNLAISIIREVQNKGIADLNMYDKLMAGVIDIIGDDLGYLIGSCEGGGAYEHELVHGRYYTDTNYRLSVDNIVGKMNNKLYDKLKNKLLNEGYKNDPDIIKDEINAYMVSGDESFGGIIRGVDYKKIKKELKGLYN